MSAQGILALVSHALVYENQSSHATICISISIVRSLRSYTSPLTRRTSTPPVFTLVSALKAPCPCPPARLAATLQARLPRLHSAPPACPSAERPASSTTCRVLLHDEAGLPVFPCGQSSGHVGRSVWTVERARREVRVDSRAGSASHAVMRKAPAYSPPRPTTPHARLRGGRYSARACAHVW